MSGDAERIAAGPVHFISACHDGDGSKTLCGVEFVFPISGNGWRVRDISCPDCDRIIVDLVHDQFRNIINGGQHGE